MYADRLHRGDRDEPVTDAFVEPDVAVDDARADSTEEDLDDLLDRRPESLDRFLDGIQAGEAPTLHFLQKPFRPSDLTNCVRRAVAAAGVE